MSIDGSSEEEDPGYAPRQIRLWEAVLENKERCFSDWSDAEH